MGTPDAYKIETPADAFTNRFRLASFNPATADYDRKDAFPAFYEKNLLR